MNYKNTTITPNFIYDTLLPILNESELKILMVVVRQTHGWICRRTGKRKLRDRITNTQFQVKAGLSKRVVTTAIQSLNVKRLIHITDYRGNELVFPADRKGKTFLFYAVHSDAHASALKLPRPVQETNHNKTNREKVRDTKLTARTPFSGHVGELLRRKYSL